MTRNSIIAQAVELVHRVAGQAQSWPYADVVGRIVAAVVVILITLVVARFVRTRLRSSRLLGKRDPAAVILLTNLIYAGILVVGIITTLNVVFGVNLTAAITAFGIGGLAVSLALQDVLRNFVAGVYILLEKPFNIGDQISLRDVRGDVLGIELRTTMLRTGAGARVIVPNSVLMTEIVTNRSLTTLQSYVVTVSGPRDAVAPLIRDRARYLGQLKDAPGVSDLPEPELTVASMDSEQTAARIRFWASRREDPVTEVVSALERSLPGASISAAAEE